MRPSDFFIEDIDSTLAFGEPVVYLDEELLSDLRRAPLADKTDLEVAVPLARLIHD